MRIILEAWEVEYNQQNNARGENSYNNVGKALDDLQNSMYSMEIKIMELESKNVLRETEEMKEKELREENHALKAVWDKYQFTKDMVTDPNKK